MTGVQQFEDEGGGNRLPCQECLAGRCRLHYRTYFAWLGGELVMAPNFPVWVCDVCGWQAFDADSVNWLRTLLNPPDRRERPGARQGWSGEDLHDDPPRTVSG